jgi:uncharacterized DUF497 family protein
MRVVWDPGKAKSNHLKHGVRFSDAEGVLFDPLAVTREDVTSTSERRFVTVGVDHIGRVVVVVYAQRGDICRLISARCATRKERLQYEEGIRF